jgi:hypothetical protein
VPTYRVYYVDPSGHISRPPELILCADDEEVAEYAKRFVDGLDIEVWDETRLVAKLPRK